MTEIDPFIRAWQERWRWRRVSSAARACRAREVAGRLAALLCQRYGARRVWLTGSLAAGRFRLDSDIDLAVAGLAPDAIFSAGAMAAAEGGGFAVDLVPVESASADYLADLDRHGTVLRDGATG